MDKLIVEATKIRGLGNILPIKSSNDYILKKSSLSSSVEEVNSLDAEVFTLTYNNLEPMISSVILEDYAPENEDVYIGDTIRLTAKVVTNNNVGVSGVNLQLYVDNTLVSEKISNFEGVVYFDYTIVSASTDFKVKYNNLTSSVVNVAAVKRDTVINIEEG